MEMCHEEVHRRFGLAHGVRRPTGRSDRQRGVGIPIEFVLRRVRILTIGQTNDPSMGFAMRRHVGQGGRTLQRPPPQSVNRALYAASQVWAWDH